MRLALLLLALAAAAPVAAQPDPAAVLDAWGAAQAAAGVRAVEADERADWTIDGPRGRVRVEVEADVRLPLAGRPERDVVAVRVDGRPARAGGDRLQRRWQRAFGPAGREVQAPPGLPGPLLARARPLGIEADRVDGVAAWRIRLASPADRLEAWFSRGDAPRLLRLRAEGSRPSRGRIVRDVRFARVGGLDVPTRAETALTALQRRRLREYTVTLTATSTYDGHRLR